VNEPVEEMVMATVHMGEYVQTMGREAAIAVFAQVIASVIAIWWETVAVGSVESVNRVDWQGPS
jgi:hypothetical protein